MKVTNTRKIQDFVLRRYDDGSWTVDGPAVHFGLDLPGRYCQDLEDARSRFDLEVRWSPVNKWIRIGEKKWSM